MVTFEQVDRPHTTVHIGQSRSTSWRQQQLLGVERLGVARAALDAANPRQTEEGFTVEPRHLQLRRVELAKGGALLGRTLGAAAGEDERGDGQPWVAPAKIEQRAAGADGDVVAVRAEHGDPPERPRGQLKHARSVRTIWLPRPSCTGP